MTISCSAAGHRAHSNKGVDDLRSCVRHRGQLPSGHDVLENLARLCRQLAAVIVVDNGSTPEELAHLRSARANLGFELIENGENLGIATALNLGIRHALTLSCTRVFLFERDKVRKIGHILPGLSHGLRGRMGRLEH